MKESISTRRNHAFVVRSSDLENLWKVLEDRVGTVTVSAECSDDVEREFDDLKELLSYDNAPTRRIVELSVNSVFYREGYFREKSVRISFPSKYGIHINIETKGQVDSTLRDKIFDILVGAKPWYSFLALRAFSFLDRPASFLIYFLIALCISIGLLFVFAELAEKFVSLDGASKSTPLFAGSLVGVTTFSMLALNGLRVWIFPLCYFALGQGEERYKIRDKVRWGIIFSLAGLLGSALLRLIW